MALFSFISCLSPEAQVRFLELHGVLGGDVKGLEQEENDREIKWGQKPIEESLAPDIPVEEDVAKIISEAPHWRGKPG